MFTVLPKNDKRQTLQIIRLFLSVCGYGILFVAYTAGLIAGKVDLSIREFMAFMSVCILINVFFYGLIRSGFNLRFKDPSLTMLQLCVALTVSSYFMIYCYPVRSSMMTGYFMMNLYGMFALSNKEYLFVTILPLLQYGGIILWDTRHPPENFSLQQDIFQWLILAVLLTWQFIVRSYVKNMRDKLRDSTALLQEINEKISKQRDEVQVSRNLQEASLLELKNNHDQIQKANQELLESLHYAELIQRSLLPGMDRLKTGIPNSFFIWMPRDIVGGDIYFTYFDQNGFIIALMDCTGHGIPGAFMTVIAYSQIRKIVLDEACRDPAEILQRLNRSVKTVLKKDSAHSLADDGLDAAICKMNIADKTLIFAGARINLFQVHEGALHTLRGDKQSLGYQDSDVNYYFKNHTVPVTDTDQFYMTSDGFIDQLGGEMRRRLGTKAFGNLLKENAGKSFETQRERFFHAFFHYKGDHEQQDDVTVIGFGMSNPAASKPL